MAITRCGRGFVCLIWTIAAFGADGSAPLQQSVVEKCLSERGEIEKCPLESPETDGTPGDWGQSTELRKLVSSVTSPTEATQSTTQHHVLGVVGSRTIYRGYSVWLEIPHSWFSVRPFTVDPASDVITAPGHTFANSALVKFFGEDALPFPLASIRGYDVCDVNGDRFKIVPDSTECSSNSRVDFGNAGSGALYVGQRLASYRHVYITNAIGGLPKGVSADIWCQHVRCGPPTAAKGYSYGGGYNFRIKLTADPTADVGPSVITVIIEATGQQPLKLNIPIEVKQLLPLRLAKPRGIPALPSLTKWENTMRTLATKWCKPGEKMLWGVSQQVWFYGGADVFYKVAKYLKDDRYRVCAENIASQYRDYVISNNGRIRGHDTFPRMLERAYLETTDPRYIEAIDMLVNKSNYALSGGGIGDNGIRETAYYLDCQTAYMRLTGKRSVNLEKTADFLLGAFDQLFVNNTFTYHQIFMDGLAARSLIEYWNLTGDPRVPVAIALAADWIWNHAWLPPMQKLMVNPEPYGPRCDWGCQAPNSDLINLSAPMYAWLFKVTGLPEYQQRADQLFVHSLDTDISYSGKIFSQNYTWSFDYVKWRRDQSGDE